MPSRITHTLRLHQSTCCAASQGCHPAAVRNRALAAIARSTDLSARELTRLMPMHCTGTGVTLYIHGAHGTSSSSVLRGPSALCLGVWITVRGQLGLGTHVPLFCTRRGLPMSTRYVMHILHRSIRSGLDVGSLGFEEPHIRPDARAGLDQYVRCHIQRLPPQAVARATSTRPW